MNFTLKEPITSVTVLARAFQNCVARKAMFTNNNINSGADRIKITWNVIISETRKTS